MHPAVPSCDECQRFLFDSKTWRPIRSGKVHAPRPPGASTPCWECPKTLRGDPPTPENGLRSELNERNREIYEHYLQCKATSQFPDDAMVRYNASLIRAVEDAATRDMMQVSLASAVVSGFK